MKMKQISDSTLKITIKLEDLEERGMELADFLIPQEKTEEFFYSVLDELDLPMTFRESGMLSFRVTPKPDKIDIFVTKSDIDKSIDFEDLANFDDFPDISQLSPEEFLKTVEKTIRDKSGDDEATVRRLEAVEEADYADEDSAEAQQAYVYYILEFENLLRAVEFAHAIDIVIETSELYKMNNHYYMIVLKNVEDQSRLYPTYFLSRMLEHADNTDISRPYLQEHGLLLLAEDALEELRKVSLT
ncbi:adapter protein MecA 1/2 [Streptococcus gallinaceus]|uniref:adaptor protein MecA n=1 Tax=Streptococcus gallinaceus TaxID=165758 RepID=UPI0020A05AF4|nr:adaptor protein MecA [Streptococcus gallinaceus]MCP1640019.1 adapter protein MecA 1/2 [Streptococcus gallinaceus]MCP1770801.1 adapter protein MecA 1/2 [Streptococcus gallinaceus]